MSPTNKLKAATPPVSPAQSPVGSVDLIGLNPISPVKSNGIAPPASPAHHQLSSPTLKQILKPGCTVREVEWKDLAIQKHVGTGSRCVAFYQNAHDYYTS
ncbi:unnamed protein product [Phytophthora fragariaefolia]|uniref:Unnamed protein product n=1 Tax=Phytophthora fragariaefolia TaxID=1490495 RepID=A0A9W6XBM1_9STRA|nr:unnamed protein product [Phytophthora fragariaefolia]